MNRLFLRVDLFGEFRRNVIEAVHLENVQRLPRKIEHLGSRELHARRQFVAPNASFQAFIVGPLLGVLRIQPGQHAEPRGISLRRNVISLPGRKQIGDRRLRPRENRRPLMLSRQKRAVPVLGAVGGQAAVIGEHDKRRQILVHAPQTIADPAPHAGKSRPVEAGRLQQRSLTVNPGLTDQVMNKSHLIHDTPQRSDDIAERLAALAIRLKFPHRFQPGTEAVLKGFHWLAEVRCLTVSFDQFRLVVKQVDMARRSSHEELHDPLRLRRMMQAPGHSFRPQQPFRLHQARQRQPAQTAAALPQKLPPTADGNPNTMRKCRSSHSKLS